MSIEEKKKYLKKSFWDIHCTPDELYMVLMGERESFGSINSENIYIRLLESYSWYLIKEIIPTTDWLKVFDEKVLEKLRFEQLRERYRVIGKLLRKATLSATR